MAIRKSIILAGIILVGWFGFEVVRLMNLMSRGIPPELLSDWLMGSCAHVAVGVLLIMHGFSAPSSSSKLKLLESKLQRIRTKLDYPEHDPWTGNVSEGGGLDIEADTEPATEAKARALKGEDEDSDEDTDADDDGDDGDADDSEDDDLEEDVDDDEGEIVLDIPPQTMSGNVGEDGYEWIVWPSLSDQQWYRLEGAGGAWNLFQR